ncbi:MAG: hypothetical protein V4733_00705 [Verrucomicrobiota bacterium]
MDSQKIKAIIIAILATFAAVYLGISAATAQVEAAAWTLGILTLVICLLLGRRIWLLVPLGLAFGLSLRLPGQPTSLLVAQFLTIFFLILLFLIRRLPFQFRFTELEAWILLLTILMAQAYIRNPVGLNIFGGNTVGGRSYFIFALTIICGVMVACLKVPPSGLKWLMRLSIIGGLLNAATGLISRFIPSIGYYTGETYTRSDTPDYTNMNIVVDEGVATRVGFLTQFGRNLALWVSSFVSPLTAIVRPFWAFLIFCSLVAAVAGGFRNGLFAVGCTYLVGIAYRQGLPGIIVSLTGAAMGVILLSLINVLQPLPPNVQRSLTIFPGTWEQRYKDDAKSSTDWRVEIWKEVLTSERWIHNKILGDGLGFSAADLRIGLSENASGGISGFDAQREQILISGDYHSGPISTIHVVGYVGLLVFICAQVRLAVRAHRQIQRCRNTEWFPLALFVGIPLLWSPFFFIFIFGSFKEDVLGFIISYSFLRLIEENLPLPRYERLASGRASRRLPVSPIPTEAH